MAVAAAVPVEAKADRSRLLRLIEAHRTVRRCDQGRRPKLAPLRVCPTPRFGHRLEHAGRKKPLGRIASTQGVSTARRLQGKFSLFQRLRSHRLLMVKAAGDADGRRENNGASQEKTHE